jgi:hypothetical protein
MNRQSSFQELLVQREDAIRFLEGRLDTSSTGKHASKNYYITYSGLLVPEGIIRRLVSATISPRWYHPQISQCFGTDTIY